MPLLRRACLLAAASAALVLGGCGDDGAADDADPAATAQATERLVGYGLTEDQAACVVDELGAATITEASDLNALVEGEAYRAAADGCIGDG